MAWLDGSGLCCICCLVLQDNCSFLLLYITVPFICLPSSIGLCWVFSIALQLLLHGGHLRKSCRHFCVVVQDFFLHTLLPLSLAATLDGFYCVRRKGNNGICTRPYNLHRRRKSQVDDDDDNSHCTSLQSQWCATNAMLLTVVQRCACFNQQRITQLFLPVSRITTLTYYKRCNVVVASRRRQYAITPGMPESAAAEQRHIDSRPALFPHNISTDCTRLKCAKSIIIVCRVLFFLSLSLFVFFVLCLCLFGCHVSIVLEHTESCSFCVIVRSNSSNSSCCLERQQLLCTINRHHHQHRHHTAIPFAFAGAFDTRQYTMQSRHDHGVQQHDRRCGIELHIRSYCIQSTAECSRTDQTTRLIDTSSASSKVYFRNRHNGLLNKTKNFPKTKHLRLLYMCITLRTPDGHD